MEKAGLTLSLHWAEIRYTCSFQSGRQLGAARQAHNGSLECHELTAIIDPGTECSGDRELSPSSVQGRIREVTYARSPRRAGACHWEDRRDRRHFPEPRAACAKTTGHKPWKSECPRMWGGLVGGGAVSEIRTGSGCLPEIMKSKVLMSFRQAPRDAVHGPLSGHDSHPFLLPSKILPRIFLPEGLCSYQSVCL